MTQANAAKAGSRQAISIFDIHVANLAKRVSLLSQFRTAFSIRCRRTLFTAPPTSTVICRRHESMLF